MVVITTTEDSSVKHYKGIVGPILPNNLSFFYGILTSFFFPRLFST